MKSYVLSSGTTVYNLTEHSNQGSRILTTTPSMNGVLGIVMVIGHLMV